MSHETARQRYRRHKLDPYRAAQIAPKVEMPPVKCLCGDLRLQHDSGGKCLSCDCQTYTETS